MPDHMARRWGWRVIGIFARFPPCISRQSRYWPPLPALSGNRCGRGPGPAWPLTL